jgi:hypothetical protein
MIAAVATFSVKLQIASFVRNAALASVSLLICDYPLSISLFMRLTLDSLLAR